MTEQSRQIISVIKDNLPKFMIPGFNTLISENRDMVWFDHFIYIYNEYVKEAKEKGVNPITPVAALDEYKKKMQEDLNKFDKFCKDEGLVQVGTVVADDGVTRSPAYGYPEDIPVSPDGPEEDLRNEEPEEVTTDDLGLSFDSVDGELETEDDTKDPSDEIVDII